MSAFEIGVSQHCQNMWYDVYFLVNMSKCDQFHNIDVQDSCQVLLEKNVKEWAGSKYFQRTYNLLPNLSLQSPHDAMLIFPSAQGAMIAEIVEHFLYFVCSKPFRFFFD